MRSLFVKMRAMRPTLRIGWKWVLLSLLGCAFVFMPNAAGAQGGAWWEQYKAQCRASGGSICDFYNQCGGVCTMPTQTTNNDNGAAQRAQAAAAAEAAAVEAQRQREAELEQERIEADNKRRAEEIAKQAKFDQEKRDALGELRGISNGDNSASGLKGVTSTDSGLKDASNAGDSIGLKTLPDVNTDTHVVDARNVPSRLPKSVEDSIPNTPAGDRVRKGFQAIQVHDWKTALAWFQDALNHEPGDPSLKRLVDLALFTLDYRLKIGTQVPGQSKQSPQNSTNKSPSGSAVTPGMDIEHVDFLAYEGAVMIAARARGTAAAEQFDKKHDPHATALDRTAAVQKAVRGEGYSKEELNRGIQEALVVVNKVRHDRQVHQKAGPDRVGLKNNPPTPARSYPDTPWGTVLRLLDTDPKQPNVYLGPTADELASGKG
jgi:hypothetical protein